MWRNTSPSDFALFSSLGHIILSAIDMTAKSQILFLIYDFMGIQLPVMKLPFHKVYKLQNMP